MSNRWFLGILVFACGCGADAVTDKPVANAGDDRSVHWGATAQLDGSASVGSGDVLGYSWTLFDRPAGSTAVLTGITTATPTLTTDLVGDYFVALTVRDGATTSDADTVRVTATNTAPVARAGGDVSATLDSQILLDGSASVDPDGDPITFSWTVTAQPTGGTAALAAPDQAITAVTPTASGGYALTLTVSDGAASATDTVVVVINRGRVTALDHDVVDAEYSNALESIVAVSSRLQALFVLDPVTGVEQAVSLPLTPTAVSLSPDGLQAVVGHDAAISLVDLAARTVVVTHPVAITAFDVVHGGDGSAYVLPPQLQQQNIHGVRLATGTAQVGTGHIRAGAVGRRHPVRSALYTADRHTIPSDIQLHALDNGRTTFVRDSPYHGDYPMCGDLWFSDDGNHVYTACGNVFHASAVATFDMTYAGNLDGVRYIAAFDHGAAANRVALIPGNVGMETDTDTRVRFYEPPSFAARGFSDLPILAADAQLLRGHGRFVFWRSDGSEYYVVVRITPSDGIDFDAVWANAPP